MLKQAIHSEDALLTNYKTSCGPVLVHLISTKSATWPPTTSHTKTTGTPGLRRIGSPAPPNPRQDGAGGNPIGLEVVSHRPTDMSIGQSNRLFWKNFSFRNMTTCLFCGIVCTMLSLILGITMWVKCGRITKHNLPWIHAGETAL